MQRRPAADPVASTLSGRDDMGRASARAVLGLSGPRRAEVLGVAQPVSEADVHATRSCYSGEIRCHCGGDWYKMAHSTESGRCRSRR